MKILRCSLQYLTFVSLFLLTASSVYNVIVGVQASSWYAHWRLEHYGAMSLPSTLWTYSLGVFRSAVTLCCGVAGLRQAAEGRVRPWYLLLLGWLTAQYILAVVQKAYKGSPAGDWVQLWIAVGCLGMMILHKYLWQGRGRN